MKASRPPSISTGLFTGGAVPAPVSDQPSDPRASSRTVTSGAPRRTRGRRKEPAGSAGAMGASGPSAGGRNVRTAGPAELQKRAYLRLHLYATQETLEQVKALQGHALIAGLKLGARGPSLVMAAALDALLALPFEARIDAMRQRLQRDEQAKESRQSQWRLAVTEEG